MERMFEEEEGGLPLNLLLFGFDAPLRLFLPRAMIISLERAGTSEAGVVFTMDAS